MRKYSFSNHDSYISFDRKKIIKTKLDKINDLVFNIVKMQI